MEEDSSSKGKEKKKSRGYSPSLDKTDFEPTKIKKDKGHYIMVKGSMQQEELTILNTIQEHPDSQSKFLETYKET